MAIKKYAIEITYTVVDIETKRTNLYITTAEVTTFYTKDSILFNDLIETKVEEIMEETEDTLLDIEKILTYTYAVTEA